MIKYQHPETAILLEECGKMEHPYLPNYDFPGYINDEHRWYGECGLKDGLNINAPIPGWLQRADAIKLYELAYHAEGDILEIGTYQGLATSIIAEALLAGNNGGIFDTIEVNRLDSKKAEVHLVEAELFDRVSFHVGRWEETCRQLLDAGRRYEVIFVDHSPKYSLVADVGRIAMRLLAPGGLILFHDYADSRNTDSRDTQGSGEEYGVFVAVEDTVVAAGYEFIGVYGCSGLLRKPDDKDGRTEES